MAQIRERIAKGNVFPGSMVHSEKIVFVEAKYDNDKQIRTRTLCLYDLKTNTKEILFQNAYTTNNNKYSSITSQICLSQDGKKYAL